jgi:hypothetical protein
MRGMIELSSFDHWLSTSQLPFCRHARCELDHNPPEVSAPSIALSAWLGRHRKKRPAIHDGRQVGEEAVRSTAVAT